VCRGRQRRGVNKRAPVSVTRIRECSEWYPCENAAGEESVQVESRKKRGRKSHPSDLKQNPECRERNKVQNEKIPGGPVRERGAVRTPPVEIPGRE